MTLDERQRIEAELELLALEEEELALEQEVLALEEQSLALAEPRESSRLETAQDFGRGVRSGATFGFADELQGLIGAALPATAADREAGRGFMDRYRAERGRAREVQAEARERSPKATLGGEITGGVATAFIPGGKLLNVGRGAKISTAAGKGAAGGAAFGLGMSEADLTDGTLSSAAQAAIETGLTAGAGAVGGAGLQALSRLPGGATAPIVGLGIGGTAGAVLGDDEADIGFGMGLGLLSGAAPVLINSAVRATASRIANSVAKSTSPEAKELGKAALNELKGTKGIQKFIKGFKAGAEGESLLNERAATRIAKEIADLGTEINTAVNQLDSVERRATQEISDEMTNLLNRAFRDEADTAQSLTRMLNQRQRQLGEQIGEIRKNNPDKEINIDDIVETFLTEFRKSDSYDPRIAERVRSFVNAEDPIVARINRIYNEKDELVEQTTRVISRKLGSDDLTPDTLPAGEIEPISSAASVSDRGVRTTVDEFTIYPNSGRIGRVSPEVLGQKKRLVDDIISSIPESQKNEAKLRNLYSLRRGLSEAESEAIPEIRDPNQRFTAIKEVQELFLGVPDTSSVLRSADGSPELLVPAQTTRFLSNLGKKLNDGDSIDFEKVMQYVDIAIDDSTQATVLKDRISNLVLNKYDLVRLRPKIFRASNDEVRETLVKMGADPDRILQNKDQIAKINFLRKYFGALDQTQLDAQGNPIGNPKAAKFIENLATPKRPNTPSMRADLEQAFDSLSAIYPELGQKISTRGVDLSQKFAIVNSLSGIDQYTNWVAALIGSLPVQMQRGANLAGLILYHSKKFGVDEPLNSMQKYRLMLEALPDSFGPWGDPLLNAANRGTQAFNAAHFTLMSRDPEYRKFYEQVMKEFNNSNYEDLQEYVNEKFQEYETQQMIDILLED